MVNENVRLIRPLGQGAMGEVWVAQHLTLRTEVAVKFITPELGTKHEEVRSRFEQEAAMAAQIKSPYVVQTFDQGTMDNGTPYIVMELLEGESLQELMDRSGALPPAITIQVIAQVARALGKAHNIGIVHRDIKPDNIFVTTTEDGLFCKILDFGIAKQTRLPQMGGLTHAGIMIGTPEYMSPEQVMSSKDVDSQADVWAVAVTSYQMLTGCLPFEGEAIGDLCVKLLQGNYELASKVRSDLPREVDQFFRTAFSRKAEKRFATIRDLARSLQLVFPDAELDPSLLETFGSLPPPAVSPLPRHRAATQAGEVQPQALRDDGNIVDIADDEIIGGSGEGVYHAAKTATLNGSAANRLQPDQVRKRKLGGWIGMAVGAAVIALLLGVVASVAVGEGDTAQVPVGATQPQATQPQATGAPPVTATLDLDDPDDDIEPVPAASADSSADPDGQPAPDASASADVAAGNSAAPRPLAPRPAVPKQPAKPGSGHGNHGF